MNLKCKLLYIKAFLYNKARWMLRIHPPVNRKKNYYMKSMNNNNNKIPDNV